MEIKEFGGRVISFKSLPEFYELERDGLKSNTIRELDGDERKAFIEWSKQDERIIEIVNTETGESFQRFVTHVHSPTFDQALISWKHPPSLTEMVKIGPCGEVEKCDWRIEKWTDNHYHIVTGEDVDIYDVGDVTEDEAKDELIDHLLQLVTLLRAAIQGREWKHTHRKRSHHIIIEE